MYIITILAKHCSDKYIYYIGLIKTNLKSVLLVEINLDVAILYKIHIFKHQFLLNPIKPFRESKSSALAKLVLAPSRNSPMHPAPMLDKIRLEAVLLVAGIAGVGLQPIMDVHVVLQALPRGELLEADAAVKRAQPRVHSHVCPQVGLLGKSFEADATLVRPLAGVGPRMDDQLIGRGVEPSALVAEVAPEAGVGGPVGPQLGHHGPADVTEGSLGR